MQTGGFKGKSSEVEADALRAQLCARFGLDDAFAVRAALAAANKGSSVHFKNDNKPIFTLKQMTMICERMCKVRHVYI